MTEESTGESRESKSTFMPIIIAAALAIFLVGIAVFPWLSLAALIIITLAILNIFRQDSDEKFVRKTVETHEKSPIPNVSKEKFGVWIFLMSEIILFGGLFVSYGFVRANSTFWPDPLQTHDAVIGMANTIILLTSSLAMILALYFIRNGNKTGMIASLAATFALGITFLEIKLGFEWPAEFRKGFTLSTGGLPASTYFMLVGIHAMHVAVGLVAISYLLIRGLRGQYTQSNHHGVEHVGLYWHFVDIVWMFLFTLFYLI